MSELLNMFNSSSISIKQTDQNKTIKTWKERARLVPCSYTVADNCRKKNRLSKNKSVFPEAIIKKNKT